MQYPTPVPRHVTGSAGDLRRLLRSASAQAERADGPRADPAVDRVLDSGSRRVARVLGALVVLPQVRVRVGIGVRVRARVRVGVRARARLKAVLGLGLGLG